MLQLRILLCGQFGRRLGYATYPNVDTKLRNGLVRCGHNVIGVSERDTVHELAPLRLKRVGVARMRQRLVDVATHYRPHLLLFGHTDLVDGATFEALRAASPGARLATFFVDPFTTRQRTLDRLRARAFHMDTVFTTTAASDLLAPYAVRPGTFHFMPNPVDGSVETARTDETERDALRWDGLFLGTDIMTRAAQLDQLETALPRGYRFHRGGRQEPGGRLASTDLLATLAEAAVCPQLALDDTGPASMPRLYTSDRIAQTMGQGVLALTPASAALEQLYEDGVVPFGSREDLADQMTTLFMDDALRRRRAGIGRRIAHERTNATRVANYMVEVALERTLSETYGWPTEVLV